MTGIELIAKERQEQIEKHGKTVENDLQNNIGGQLKDVAVLLIKNEGGKFPSNWKLDTCIKLSNKSEIDKLIIAGALIAAEIDRINALTPQQSE